jgi:hypothetical protein
LWFLIHFNLAFSLYPSAFVSVSRADFKSAPRDWAVVGWEMGFVIG